MRATLDISGQVLTVRADINTSGPQLRQALPVVQWSDGAKADCIQTRELPTLVKQASTHHVRLSATYQAIKLVRQTAAELRRQSDFLQSLGDAGLTLYPYQEDGVAFLHQKPVALLFDEMGLGKTVQALCALPPNAAALIVCPKSLKTNWFEECRRWRQDLAPHIIDSKKSFRWADSGEVLIANYEILPSSESALLNLPTPGTTLVADEAQYLKTWNSQRTANFRLLANRVRKRNGYIQLLTGTPLMNKPPELWALLTALDIHKICYGSFWKFAKLFGGVQDAFGWQWPPNLIRADCMAPIEPYALRRTRAQVLPDLPSKRYSIRYTPKPTGELLKVLNSIDLDRLTELLLSDKESDAGIENVALARKELAAFKFATAGKDIIDEYQNSSLPLVVWSAHRWPIDELDKTPGWLAIHGGVSQIRRAEIVNTFQSQMGATDGIVHDLACTIQTAGLGLTLTAASDCMFVDRMYTPAANLQAEDRLCRIGQRNSVQVIDLVADHPVDKRVHEILCSKAALVASTTEKLNSTPQAPINRLELASELERIAELMNGNR